MHTRRAHKEDRDRISELPARSLQPRGQPQEPIMQDHIEHYFPKGYNPGDEPWKSIRQFHNAALAAAERQLTAEREAFRKRKEHWQQVAEAHNCEGLTDAFVQLTAEREASAQYKAGSQENYRMWQTERERANAAELEVDERGRTIIHYKQELAAERSRNKELQDEIKQLKTTGGNKNASTK